MQWSSLQLLMTVFAVTFGKELLDSKWPTGKYGLPMALDGCPETEQQGWTTGYINMTIESKYSPQSWNDDDPLTFEPHLMGPYQKRILKINFCIKEDSENGASDVWPSGRYCIYQFGDECPQGFTSGSTIMTGYHFTDDDISGILPKYNVKKEHSGNVTGFELFFCCRSDSTLGKFTFVDQVPFFVLKHGEECPGINEGSVSEEVFNFTVGSEPWTFNTPHPTTLYKPGAGNVDFVYCYYSPLDLKDCHHENDHGYSYNGLINETESGIPCSEWKEHHPIWKPSWYTGDFPLNHCRLYSWNSSPWIKQPSYRPFCRVIGPNGEKGWEFCPVPKCNESDDHPFLRSFKPVYSVPQHDTQVPEYAVDSSIGGTSFVSKRPYVRPWIQVDMEHFYEVFYVLVYRNQRYYPRIFRHVNVYVSKHRWDFIDHGAPLCEGFKTPFVAPVYRFNCRRPITGQFVTIRNFDFTDPSGTEGIMNIMEIAEILISVKDTNCGRQLGMTSGAIYDFQLSVSSHVSDYDIGDGRLMGRKGICLNASEDNPYFQVDLIVPVRIQGLILQGWREGYKEKYIKSFSVSYSVDTNNFSIYEDPPGHKKVFMVDRTMTVDYPQRFLFAHDVLATIIRINIKDHSDEPCLKLDLIGCPKRVERDLMCAAKTQFFGWEVMKGYGFWLPEGDNHVVVKNINLEKCFEQCLAMDPPCIAVSLEGTSCKLKTGHRYTRLSKSFVKTSDRDLTAHRLCFKGVSDLNQCGGNITEPTLLTSPAYPLYYGSEVNCSWFITFPAGTNIKIDVLEVNFPTLDNFITVSEFPIKTGKCEDMLTIENPSMRTTLTLAEKNTGSVVYSEGNEVIIRLSSCHRYTKIKGGIELGFVLNITGSDCAGCGFDSGRTSYICTEKCGYLASQNFPSGYKPNTKQYWKIEGMFGQYIELLFLNLDIPSDKNCNDAHVAVFDFTISNDKIELGKYCRWNRMDIKSLRSSWHKLQVEFFTEYSEQGSGFLTKFNMIDFEYTVNESRSQEDCAEGWQAYDESCYTLFRENKGLTWFDAENKCKDNGGHLASVGSKEEMMYLHHLMTTIWNVTSPVFIGLQKVVDEKESKHHFLWTDGLPLTYMDWHSDSTTRQPDGQLRERCTVIKLSSLWSIQSWHDFMCAYNKYDSFICEITKTINTEIEIPNTGKVLVAKHLNGFFSCENGEFISEAYVCDGISDCSDSSDEQRCGDTGTCHENSFKCLDGSCISISLYCDYRKDCPDGSDENSCVSPDCSDNEWKCQNGECISQEKRCDFRADCVDGSDEQTCDLCNDKGFQCYDQSCIPRTRVCDGFVDCSGPFQEDENELCVNNAKESCAAWFALGKTEDGIYMVDYGEKGSFAVECIFPKEHSGTVKTIVHHAYEDRIIVSDSAHINIPSSASDKQLMKLKQSNTCHQFLKIECRYGGVAPDTSFGFRNGSTLLLENSLTNDCSCLLTAACTSGNNKCNCAIKNEKWYSIKSYEWYADEGYIDQEDLLPLKNVTMEHVDAVFRALAAFTVGPLICTGDTAVISDSFLCKNGITSKLKYRCMMDTDENGEIMGCRDLSHLEACENYKCGDNFLKCPNSFCIPRRMYCDGVKHCPDGSDENNCGGVSCPGLYRCRHSEVCLQTKFLCDGIKNCKHGDDELICEQSCPIDCTCEGLSAQCHGTDLLRNLSLGLKKIDISYSEMSYSPLNIGNFSKLGQLNISHCHIKELEPNTFAQLRNLYSLDVENNSLTELKPGSFRGLGNLQNLNLYENELLHEIYHGTFIGLNKLPNLSLTYTRIETLQSDTFHGLSSLTLLNLSYGNIHTIANHAFSGLKQLKVLDLRGNNIQTFSEDVFEGLSNLEFLYTESQTLCCLRPESVERINCLPAENEFSSCKDLMRNSTLRMFLWLIGTFALVGNGFVILYRLFFDRITLKKTYGIFVANLGLADFLMGVYLFIIASADQYFRDKYVWNDYLWRNGFFCKFAGFLATLSSETSTIILCLITLDRVFAIKFTFSKVRFTPRKSFIASIFVWMFTFFISILPLIVPSYFQNVFYSKTGVCLALPLTRDRSPGWEYSIGVFIIFNFIAFMVIALGQGLIYMEIRAVSAANMRKTGSGNELQVARNLFLVVITDFICWFPIAIMGMLATAGYPIHSDVYAWTAVFILPLNSALNPILYTATAIIRKKEQAKSRAYTMKSISGMTTTSAVSNST